MGDNPQSPGMVFVVGCPRSGTSLVGAILAAHPDVYDAEEATLVYLLSRWQAALQSPPVAPMTETFLEQLGELVRDTMTRAGQQRSAAYVTDHTPWHVLCLDALFTLFPHAWVLHVVRNPWDTVDSLTRSFDAGYTWAGSNTRARVQIWSRCLRAIEPYRDDLRVHELRYEDLCHRPQATAQRLVEALGLAWDGSVLTPYTRLHAGASSTRTPLGELHGGAVFFRAPPRFPQTHNEEVTQLAREEAEDLVHRYGYPGYLD